MSRMVKKTIELNQDFVDLARLVFGVKTEKEAVNRALLSRPMRPSEGGATLLMRSSNEGHVRHQYLHLFHSKPDTS